MEDDVGACLECKRTQIEKQRAEGSEHYCTPRGLCRVVMNHSVNVPPASRRGRLDGVIFSL